MPRGEKSNVADGLENVVAAETVLSKVDGDAGVLILRGHYLQDIAGRRSFEWLTGLLWEDFVDRPLSEAELRRDLGMARERAFARHEEWHRAGNQSEQRADRGRHGQRYGSAVRQQAVHLRERRTAEILHEDAHARRSARELWIGLHRARLRVGQRKALPHGDEKSWCE